VPDLEDKVALVTGGSRGIGAGICEELVRQGASLVFNDMREDEKSVEMLTKLRSIGGEVEFVPADVSVVAEVQHVVAATVERFGRIDILVNNAGGGVYQEVPEITEETWDRMVDVHLKAPFFAAQAAAPHMLENGFGRIINISSEQAYIGFPLLAHYTAAKGGLLTLTRSLALAFAPHINVNAVSPGPTDTEKLRAGPEYVDEVRDVIPLKRWGTPRDVALTVAFLAGEGGAFYTGQHLDPNGGTVMP
jgi:NAD(P)-dependent dehydrogenase (short-subunit alcohol dehydrogenase family)